MKPEQRQINIVFMEWNTLTHEPTGQNKFLEKVKIEKNEEAKSKERGGK